jgi:hypothetical protein
MRSTWKKDFRKTFNDPSGRPHRREEIIWLEGPMLQSYALAILQSDQMVGCFGKYTCIFSLGRFPSSVITGEKAGKYPVFNTAKITSEFYKKKSDPKNFHGLHSSYGRIYHGRISIK